MAARARIFCRGRFSCPVRFGPRGVINGYTRFRCPLAAKNQRPLHTVRAAATALISIVALAPSYEFGRVLRTFVAFVMNPFGALT